MKRRLVVRLLALAVLLAAGSVLAVVLLGDGEATPRAYRGSPPGARLVLPDFSLPDSTGEVVRSRAFADRVVLVTFLDTKCTDACPIIASQIGLGLRLLTREQQGQVVALAVSTDPVNDTPAAVNAFLRVHRVEGRLRYLVGSEPDLRPVWTAFYVLPAFDTGDPSLHSAPVRVFDRKGRWVSTLHAGADLTPDNLRHDLVSALAGS